ncbi:ribosome maturation factor RimM [Oleiphilus sp. HI0117]|nr:ribosome maturation factor RimM [Oleiphilus sp. HI0117]KZY48919.1 ribosome maturation factor RimM [Oleiphilus sp. HI0050]KZZ32550.1 ribosome maturation factor RimM [Oleiphilus sp. HI0117]
MGKITSVYGVKGWVKVFSYTQPKENICQYKNWTLEGGSKNGSVTVLSCKAHGNGLVAQLKGCHDRDEAKQYCGSLISVPREELPELPSGDYYWHQLQGLKVFASGSDVEEKVLLGRVDHLIETGSNDVLVVKKCKDSLDGRERLIPYLPDQVVLAVDLEAGSIEVDWDPEF